MAGLQIFDQNGSILFDETTPIVKFLGTLNIGSSYTGETKSGSITDYRFTAYPGHTAFFARTDGRWNSDYYDAEIEINGNTLTWTYPADVNYIGGFMYGRPDQNLLYGIL